MKIEVGMYVRFKDTTNYIKNNQTNISKIKFISEVMNGLDETLEITFEDYPESILKRDIIKASYEITDLIEEDDYIRIISSAYFEPVYYSYGKLVIRDDIDIKTYSNEFIAEVLTHEQIKQVSYKNKVDK